MGENTPSRPKWEHENGATDVDAFLAAYAEDDNVIWAVEPGHIQNIVDELIDRGRVERDAREAAERERDALRAEMESWGEHDPTGADHMEEMWVHAQRADAAEARVAALEEAIEKAQRALRDELQAEALHHLAVVMAAGKAGRGHPHAGRENDRGEPPDEWYEARAVLGVQSTPTEPECARCSGTGIDPDLTGGYEGTPSYRDVEACVDCGGTGHALAGTGADDE